MCFIPRKFSVDDEGTEWIFGNCGKKICIGFVEKSTMYTPVREDKSYTQVAIILSYGVYLRWNFIIYLLDKQGKNRAMFSRA